VVLDGAYADDCDVFRFETWHVAVTVTGSVWSWGSGEYGATGLGDAEVKRTPWIIQTGLSGKKITSSACLRCS
jgi:alpha-tubulin suppressor-like RCC1 family protein